VKRHDFIYDSDNHTSREEARSAIRTAKVLARQIIQIIKEDNPEKRLFE